MQDQANSQGAATSPAPSRTTPKPTENVVSRGVALGLRALGRAMGQLGRSLANGRRRLLRKKVPDYVVIALDHAVSERAPTVPWWYAYVPWVRLPLSLEYLHTALERIAADPDVRGVVFLVKSPALSLAKAQSLAHIFRRFHAWDADFRAGDSARRQPPAKEIVVHLEDGGAAAWILAAAADRAYMTPLSNWSFAGLRVAPLYLQETFARLGLVFDVVRIAPWKSAFENWQRSRMSPENRDQQNWLLDSLFDDIVTAVAEGRKLPPETVRACIDQAPLTAEETCAAGLVDGIAYEDELPAKLRPAGADAKPARLARYAQVRGLLYRPARNRHAKAIGVLSLEGAIVPGESRRYPVPLPLFGDRFIGSSTVAFQVRAARKNRRLAAVVLHVDSRGGSALASDLMWRELRLLAQEKPLVVYMGDVAASGGYYISIPGRKIVAQRATLTGSIGVVTAKLVTGEAADKLGANREVVQRGANADLNAEDHIWNEAQRRKVHQGIEHIYAEFKARVSEGRNLPVTELDTVALGRVWTGAQALAHGLVDALGDFATAVELACAEANLPRDGSVPTVALGSFRHKELATPAAISLDLRESSTASLVQAAYAAITGDWAELLGRDPYWLWADGLPILRE